jgi:DNA-binding ferritin-like protein (Dps family)
MSPWDRSSRIGNFVLERMVGYFTSHTVMRNYENRIKKFSISSFRAYQICTEYLKNWSCKGLPCQAVACDILNMLDGAEKFIK